MEETQYWVRKISYFNSTTDDKRICASQITQQITTPAEDRADQ